MNFCPSCKYLFSEKWDTQVTDLIKNRLARGGATPLPIQTMHAVIRNDSLLVSAAWWQAGYSEMHGTVTLLQV